MFDLSISKIKRLSIHFLNHDNGDSELCLSEEVVSLTHKKVNELIRTYTIEPFVQFEDYHRFSSSEDNGNVHPLKELTGHFFNRQKDFHDHSKQIARHLFSCSGHHGIKSGELLVTWISDVRYEDEVIDAIGIFKSEQKVDFLKFLYEEGRYDVQSDQGVHIRKLDKGCLIFNTNAEEGYIVASVDRTSKNLEAQYWKDDFLNIRPLSDNFHLTAQYLNMAQTYVSHKLDEDFEMTKGQQLGLLHDTGQYFKRNQAYHQDEFEEDVLGGNPDLIESFQNYKHEYARELNVDIPDQFGISNVAVKRSAKDFKSVLKLDKNFHVYIHGNRDMIQHGVDPDGRKFYKLYYDQES